MNPNPRTSTGPTPCTVTPNPPKAKTDAERQARQAEEAKRHEANVSRREAAALALVSPSAPESARRSSKRWSQRTPAEMRAMGEARDDLHRRLDALDGKLPSRVDLVDLLDKAVLAFGDYTVSGRALALSRRFLAERRDEEEEEPEYKGDAVM